MISKEKLILDHYKIYQGQYDGYINGTNSYFKENDFHTLCYLHSICIDKRLISDAKTFKFNGTTADALYQADFNKISNQIQQLVKEYEEENTELINETFSGSKLQSSDKEKPIQKKGKGEANNNNNKSLDKTPPSPPKTRLSNLKTTTTTTTSSSISRPSGKQSPINKPVAYQKTITTPPSIQSTPSKASPSRATTTASPSTTSASSTPSTPIKVEPKTIDNNTIISPLSQTHLKKLAQETSSPRIQSNIHNKRKLVQSESDDDDIRMTLQKEATDITRKMLKLMERNYSLQVSALTEIYSSSRAMERCFRKEPALTNQEVQEERNAYRQMILNETQPLSTSSNEPQQIEEIDEHK